MIFIAWLLCALIGAMIGREKGETSAGFILGLVLGPIVLLIILLSKGNKRVCPYCKEYINKDATRCSKCQKDLESSKIETVINHNETKAKYLRGFLQKNRMAVLLVILAVSLILLVRAF